jgi:hypothetical protein
MASGEQPTAEAVIDEAVTVGAAAFNRDCDGAVLPAEARVVIAAFLRHFPAGMELRRWDRAEGRMRRLSCDDLRFLGDLVAEAQDE